MSTSFWCFIADFEQADVNWMTGFDMMGTLQRRINNPVENFEKNVNS